MSGFFYALTLGLALLLLIFNQAASLGAAEGLRLFACSVLPCLFPFMVCGHCLTAAGVTSSGGAAKKRLLPLRRLGLAVVCAVCGTPSAALVCGRLYLDGMSTKKASALCAVMNLVNPYFIIGLLSRELLHSSLLWKTIAIAHYLPALAAALLLSLGEGKTAHEGLASAAMDKCGARTLPSPAPSYLTVFGRALTDATLAILRIGGTVVFFRVLYSVAEASGVLSLLSPAFGAVAAGMLEMTNGLTLLAAAHIGGRLCTSLCCALLSFGGVCIFIQSKQFFEELDAKCYFAVKLLTGACSFLLCHILYPLAGGAVDAMHGLDESLLFSRAAETACLAVCIALALAASLTYARLAVRRRTI